MSDQDRYPPPPGDPAQWAEWMRRVDARLDAMEGQPLVGANFTARDGTDDRLIGGKLDPSGDHYGIRVPAVGGTYDALYADERGMDTPQFAIPAEFPHGAAEVTQTIASGAGWGLFGRIVLPPVVSQAAARLIFGYQVAGGSTCQFGFTAEPWAGTPHAADPTLYQQFTLSGSGLAGGAGSQESCDWLHQIPLGDVLSGANYYFLDVYGRVTAGAGALTVYQPWVALMNEDHGATSAGLWQAV